MRALHDGDLPAFERPISGVLRAMTDDRDLNQSVQKAAAL
ncbi:MAG: hypothetical protein QOK36_1080, partial [Gaiellales bacterium]|nr:hypothetical protein [Gaiellales bacterium]